MTTLEALYDKIFYTLIASQLKHIALPAIGTGSYGMPKEASARIAVSRAQHYAERHQITVEFSIQTEDEFNIYNKLIESK